MGRRTRISTLVALAAVALAVAACGSKAVAGVPTAAAPISVPPAGTFSPQPTFPLPTIAPLPPTTPTPPPLAAKGPRPANGEARPAKRSGLGELDVDNGTDADAYVTLAKGGKAALTVYVWKGSTVKVGRIADGDYTLFYSTGDGWNSEVRKFTSGVAAAKFDEALDFRTTSTTSSVFTIGLQPTVAGNASTSDVSADDIPS